MLKKFSLFIGCFSLIAMIACSSNDVAGGTIDPNTLAIASSSSIDESSSSSHDTNRSDVDPDIKAESSSDSDIYPDTPITSSSSSIEESVIESRNFDIKYIGFSKEDGSYLQPVNIPNAYKWIEGDSVNVTLDVHMNIPCETDMLESFVEFVNSRGIVTALSEDTLYVDIPQSQEFSYDCTCTAMISFTLDKEYSGFNFAIFDHKDKMSVKEKIKKVDN